ncbi:MAG: energy transducer TonB [Verrucomicrobiota bacterium]|nr:energy transducer TonB [Verrucomicrobiota bacterium]
MKTAALLTFAAVLVGCATASARITKVEIDGTALFFLRRHLVSGGDFSYPEQAAAAKYSGSAGYLMELNPEGSIRKLKLKMSSGNAAIDEHVKQTLQRFVFKPGTKGPLQWYISFFWPDRIKVILTPGRDQPKGRLIGRKP